MAGYDRLVQELQRRAAGKPELAEIAAFYGDLLSAQARVDVGACDVSALAQTAPSRIERGLPILSPDAFRADGSTLARLADEICVIAARHRPELANEFEAIRAWLHQQRDAMVQVAAEYLRDEGFRKGEEAGMDDPLLAFALNNALHPFLRRYAKALALLVDEPAWYRSRCPICGGQPDFAALAKESGARRLLCSRCDFEWAYWRIACPFCECDDPDQQKYSLSEDRVYRLCLCARCNRYLKTIDLRETPDERLLPIERILTLHIDFAAREAGYATALRET
jgi:FdhE protein